jgi:N-acetylmuramoyl-L-alanine amidase
VEVRYQGDRVARWPLVSSPERLPEDAEHPTVLSRGDELLIPVRAVVALGKGWVDWDERSHTVTITPTVRRLELRSGDRGLEVRIEASAPVKVTSVRLPNLDRVAIDVTPARFQFEHAPEASGIVRSIRLGQNTKETARAVLELTGGPVRVDGLPHSATIVTARLRPGRDAVVARAPEPAATVEPSGSPASPPPSSATAEENRIPSPVSPAPSSAVLSPPGSTIGKRQERTPALRDSRSLSSRGGFVRRDPRAALLDPGSLLAGKVICVDPGHGGSDTGALGPNGAREADACLDMAGQVARALREAGATVLLTREGDSRVTLEERYNFANQKGADLFISIHCNAAERHNTMSGTETYYWSPQSLDLARAVHPEVVRVMGGRDGAIRRRTFAVIHHTTMPAILLEVGYIDSSLDEPKLRDPAFQEAFGNAVRQGVVQYLAGL